jgi:hypothetical protein
LGTIHRTPPPASNATISLFPSVPTNEPSCACNIGVTCMSPGTCGALTMFTLVPVMVAM